MAIRESPYIRFMDTLGRIGVVVYRIQLIAVLLFMTARSLELGCVARLIRATIGFKFVLTLEFYTVIMAPFEVLFLFLVIKLVDPDRKLDFEIGLWLGLYAFQVYLFLSSPFYEPGWASRA